MTENRCLILRLCACAISLVLLSACANAPSAESVSETITQQSMVVLAPAEATQTALANTVAQLFEGTAMAGTATHEFSIANPSSVPPTSPPDSDQDPAEAARRFLTATFEADGVTMARYTCSRDSEVGGFAGILVTLMLGSANAFLSEFAPGAVASVDFSDVTFSIVSRSGSQATVRAYGQVIFTIGGGFQQRHLDMEIPLVYESRRWRACGNIN